MRKLGLFIAVVPTLVAQSSTSPCDLNGDGAVNVADVQIAVNEALGLSACTMDLDGTGTCDVADVQRVIAAALGGACIVTPPASSSITLPIEVIGPAGTTNGASFNVASGSNLSGTMQLSMQIHNLTYETEASVQVNNSGWMPISSSTVTLLGRANAYGGIGGGYFTLSMTMNLPAGTITTGTNTVTFQFNGTDGKTSGYRVIGVNVLASDGTQLLPSSLFTWDDPTTWQPPSTVASDISAGSTLWHTASLTIPSTNGGSATPILAHCTDCHSEDGRDLKYFNYSNNSIVARSQFHGLTAQQGNQIASYIRTLNAPASAGGRPWNPPYQPGPGMDSKPVSEWAAGAGIGAVLDKDEEMVPYLMPGGSTANFSPTAYVNAREMPITMQLPDWNHWLPAIHPKDAWGSAFTSSELYQLYVNIRSSLTPNDATSYENEAPYMKFWILDDSNFLGPLIQPTTSTAWNNPTYVDEVYGTRLWEGVKWWEINQEYGLEGMAQSVFGPQSATRSWFTNAVFFISPNMCDIPSPSVGLGNGLGITHDYFSMMWYQLQLVLNDGNGTFAGTTPIDFPYVYGFVQGIGHGPVSSGQGGLIMEWMLKGLQASQFDPGPDQGSMGWQYWANDPLQLVKYPNSPTLWTELTPSDRTTMLNAYMQSWLTKISSYSLQQFVTGGWTTAGEVPDPNQPEGDMADRVAVMMPLLQYWGVSPTLMSQVATWAKSMWPSYNWSASLQETCALTSANPWVVCQ